MIGEPLAIVGGPSRDEDDRRRHAASGASHPRTGADSRSARSVLSVRLLFARISTRTGTDRERFCRKGSGRGWRPSVMPFPRDCPR